MLLPERESSRPDFYVAALADEALPVGFKLAQTLRDAGFTGEMGFARRSMKSSMRQAAKSCARYTLLLGPDELAAGQVTVKNMDSGEQQTLAMEQIATLM